MEKLLERGKKLMLYLSEIYALNICCNLETWGDWHQSALNWENIRLLDSDVMFFGEYGIEENKTIPEHKNKYNVANHIRAILDLLEMGKYSVAQGMRKDFIGTDIYEQEIFELVYKMKVLNNWNDIDDFMGKEYFMKWVSFKEGKTNESKLEN